MRTLYNNPRVTLPSSQTLSAPILPARLNAKDVAEILGFQEHDIPVLVSARMLRPLGKPVPNATKYFATCEILVLVDNGEWLEKATKIIYGHWHDKNNRKTKKTLGCPKGNGSLKSLETFLAE